MNPSRPIRRPLLCCTLLSAAALVCAPATAAVSGMVTAADGTAIEHARVEIVETGGVAFSDLHGTFRFEDADPPVELKITHPRFVEHLLSVDSGETLSIALEAKLEIYQRIAVSANPGEEVFSPVSVATSVIDIAESPVPPATLTAAVAGLPAVAENGQGGMFQTYSVRGVSRQRVMTLVDGMRIVGERRAGVSASFVDPGLMGSVDVVRGPSSTYYGSGALGGVVQLFPREFDALAVEAGYDTGGDENFQLVGWGDGTWSMGIARRDAGDAETPDGETLNSAFSQVSGTLGREWRAGKLSYGVQFIASRGDDIGKSNTDFPDKVTTYPEERHTLLRFDVQSDNDWGLDAWIHPNSLETRVEEGGDVSTVENEATDFGIDWHRRLRLSDRTVAKFGVEYFARRGVESLEGDLDGREDEAGLYGAMEWHRGSLTILAGARVAFQQQDNAGFDDVDDEALTGFAGIIVPFGDGLELTANAGTGLRFASLGERYFSGLTGRGEVIGNPSLDPERSINVDVGLRRFGKRLFISGYLFRNAIEDYIERVEIAEDLLTFVNVDSGVIQGVELDGFLRVDAHWDLLFGGHMLEGRDDDDLALSDIPADRATLGARWKRGAWGAEARWEQRFDKNDPGSGEKPIGSASLVSASLARSFGDAFSLSIEGRNLLNEEYFNAADRKVPLSAERSIGVALRWRR
ncbi:MAG: TonB-dependent receptor [bacterium]|nr:TonB-dependent receptor [bacterium]